jgi:transposase-like protein
MKPGTRRRRMRCPECSSTQTVRNGKRALTTVSFSRHVSRKIQCFHCCSCGKYFTCRRASGKKYTKEFREEIARMHVEERMSYRVISKRVRERLGKTISPTVLCGMVNEVARHSKSSWAIQREYSPRWSGYLIVDDKYLSFNGTKRMSLVAVDSSGDPIHTEVLEEDSVEGVKDFLLYIRDRLQYPIKGITTDLDPVLDSAITHVFTGEIRHQKCLWHALEIVRRMIGYAQLARRKVQIEKRLDVLSSKTVQWQHEGERDKISQELKEITYQLDRLTALISDIRNLLYAPSQEETQEIHQNLLRREGRKFAAVFNFLDTHLTKLTMHQEDAKLQKTSNIAENLNRQFERRLKTIESFHSFETAFNYLNLYRNYLRFKPYTDCKGPRAYRNGLCPIELCKVVLSNHDWVKLSVKWS